MLENGYKGAQDPNSGAGMFNAIQFIARQLLAKCNHAAIVQVTKVTNTGGLAPVGFVDVQPMVNQLDGYGKGIENGIIHNIPYFRLQGGAAAVILDPVVGDIGIAVFNDVDSSVVAATKKKGNPGSYRRNHMNDGIYMGGILNGTPTEYIEFSASGVKVHSASAVTVDAPAVNLQNGGAALLKLVNETFMTLFNAHVHSSSGAGAPTVPMTVANLTTYTKAE